MLQLWHRPVKYCARIRPAPILCLWSNLVFLHLLHIKILASTLVHCHHLFFNAIHLFGILQRYPSEARISSITEGAMSVKVSISFLISS